VPGAQVEAAGGVLWRGDPSAPEVALVHRPRYGDWSLPKGKLEPGEHPLLAALREIEEETGLTARPGRRVGTTRYQVVAGSKRVRYWACEATGGAFQPNAEVDVLQWARLPQALERLDPARDGQVLASFGADTRRTRALVLVRHASAGDKREWTGPDADRPLDEEGTERIRTVAALLTAYDVEAAGVADVRRCRDTLAPYARDAGLQLQTMANTTAGAFEPQAATDEVAGLLDGRRAAAWCGQREVIPDLAEALCTRFGGAAGDGAEGLRKGALAVLHIDEQSRFVALERLPG
jgi:8-oxo-dGTP pyrophosphatase MutT (NUDIX family)/phosphohistidine phosphatase SixA